MKKIILLLLSVAFQFIAEAQTDHYPNNSGVINRSDYSYVYRPFGYGNSMELFNQDTVFFGQPNTNKDGSKIDASIVLNKAPIITGANISMADVKSIVSSFFTNTQKVLLKEHTIMISAIADSSTGEVTDVIFTIFPQTNFKNIPIEVYRNIELKLKQDLKYQLTEDGKRLNYIWINWEQAIY